MATKQRQDVRKIPRRGVDFMEFQLSVVFDILKTLYLKIILNIQKSSKKKTSKRRGLERWPRC